VKLTYTILITNSGQEFHPCIMLPWTLCGLGRVVE